MLNYMRRAVALSCAAALAACSDRVPTQPEVTNSGVIAAAPTRASALASAPWGVAWSPTAGATVIADGTTGTATMNYSSPYSPNYGIGHVYRFTTVANEAGIAVLPWTFSGFHSFYMATAYIRGYIRRSGSDLYPTGLLASGGVSGGFSWSGTASFAVLAGDEYGLEIYGYHFDATNALTGTLSVTPAVAPTVSLSSPAAISEGSSASFVATASDPNNDISTYAWEFGDGGTSAAGASTSHTYAQDGVYSVRVIVTDTKGLADTATTTATVTNVAPSVSAIPDASLLVGGTYTAAGTFSDPGADSWSATVNYGDGSGTAAVALSGTSFALSHTYATAGTFTVTLNILDDDTTTPRTATVVVQAPPPPPPPPSASPTTKDQCMKDGWKAFGFKNQGLCIQYVNTGKDSRP